MKLFALFSTLSLGVFFLPDSVLAQSGFVTCSGPDCSLCHLVGMANVIIVWLFGILFVVFAVLMAVAGFGLVTSGGSPAALEAAKSKFQNGIVGIIIVMAAWLIVDTLLRGVLAGGTGEISGYGPWAEVKCQTQTAVQQYENDEPGSAAATPPDPTINATCTDDAALMAKYKGSPIGVEAPGLRTMINCYMGDSKVASMVDTAQLYTVDRSHPRCALTNGNKVCGPCSHSTNSMHYGRGSGLGARAVDFNARGGAESALYTELRRMQSVCGGALLFEQDHTHISMP